MMEGILLCSFAMPYKRLREFQYLLLQILKTALEHFAINRDAYVLIISDLRMPSLNGMELIKRIKDVNPFVRTILMTAFTTHSQLKMNYFKNMLNMK